MGFQALYQVTYEHDTRSHVMFIVFSTIHTFVLTPIALPVGATIIISSTVSPGFVTRLKQRLQGKLFH